MSTRPKVSPTPDTVQNQKLAGDPGKSIWVSANAGSGKTHILTERVLRLLLKGVAPENILCLTYTKAAAAEMKNRLAKRLGQWTLQSDEELHEALLSTTGFLPDGQLIQRARTLFALALETPGGLKINTIHAFCEAALHRFPLEAGVPVNFSVIEDVERQGMINSARDEVLAGGLEGNRESEQAVSTLFSLMSDAQILGAVENALGQGPDLRKILSDIPAAKAALRHLCGFDPQRDLQLIDDEIVRETQLSAADIQNLFALIEPKPGQGRRFVDVLARMNPRELTKEGLLEAFLTKEGKPRSVLISKKIATTHPELLAMLEQERERISALAAEANMIRLVKRSEALLDVMSLIHARYEAVKGAADRLDFDDLIIKFEQLLDGRVSSAWVRYKLDAGMTHILVDESQDTNPDQWRVIRLLVDEFYSGKGATDRHRTLFGVGDEKQSIYGFQGAVPELFSQIGAELKIKAKQAEKYWENVPFRASFRTLPNILEAVDLVSERRDIRNALLSGDEPVTHESARQDRGGSVTIWPPCEAPPAPAPDGHWPLEPARVEKTPMRLNAEKLAARIKGWLDEGRPLGARRRAVVPSDILILVQRRSPFFKEIIRALKHFDIPTPGADKLPVNEHIVVRDLLVLGDVLINPNDDLGLATVLRSPLFDLSFAQLEELAAKRKEGVSLWMSLKEKARDHPFAGRAHETLADMRQRLDFDRPYEFFSHILFVEQGLKKFHQRLGEEIDEVISVFLDLALAHEGESQPSLQGFLAGMRAHSISVKRELAEVDLGVRVMSVHGAKGLEAPIVILADATAKPPFKQSVFMQTRPVPLFVHGSQKTHIPETEQVLRDPAQEKAKAEYWRLLYVAMTRAEDELYITGDKLPDEKSFAQTWYGAVTGALEGKTIEIPLPGEDLSALRFPVDLPAPAAAKAQSAPSQKTEQPVDLAPLSPPQHVATVRPSLAFEEGFTSQIQLFDGLETVAEQVGREIPDKQAGPEQTARDRGVALHALLQHLAPLGADRRREMAPRALEHLLPRHPSLHAELAEKALKILSGEHSHLLFGPNSRAELPIFVNATRGKNRVRIIGRIDRTIIMEDEVLLVDFKSNARPPESWKGIGPHYLTQMGLYLRCGQKLFPGRQISTAIYWTASETLMGLDNEALLEATNQFNII